MKSVKVNSKARWAFSGSKLTSPALKIFAIPLTDVIFLDMDEIITSKESLVTVITGYARLVYFFDEEYNELRLKQRI